jgi:hypothetical protein
MTQTGDRPTKLKAYSAQPTQPQSDRIAGLAGTQLCPLGQKLNQGNDCRSSKSYDHLRSSAEQNSPSELRPNHNLILLDPFTSRDAERERENRRSKHAVWCHLRVHSPGRALTRERACPHQTGPRRFFSCGSSGRWCGGNATT